MVQTISPDQLWQRFQLGREYLDSLAHPTWRSEEWMRGYEEFLLTSRLESEDPAALSLPKTLALCHPKWWTHLVEDRRAILLGESFPRLPPTHTSKCQSGQVLGYECPFHNPIAIHQDHLFPNSLGGATDSENRLLLCADHNYLKGIDIHLYPWERPRPTWVDAILKRIANLF